MYRENDKEVLENQMLGKLVLKSKVCGNKLWRRKFMSVATFKVFQYLSTVHVMQSVTQWGKDPVVVINYQEDREKISDPKDKKRKE